MILRSRSVLATLFGLTTLLACVPNRSYILLVTATPSYIQIGGGGGDSPSSPPGVFPSPTAVPTPTFIPTPNPTRTAVIDPTEQQVYIVQSGDTLSTIAQRYGITVESIAEVNNLPNQNILSVGQVLIIPLSIQTIGTSFKIIPDSELVYGPTLQGFTVETFLQGYNSFLGGYTETLDGQTWTGAAIVERVALEQSINPRLLLALLEYQSQWVSQSTISDTALLYPMGYLARPTETYGLYRQLDWAGKMLNTGYYGWKQRGLAITLLSDGTRVGLAPTLNAGTAGVQVLLSQTRDLDLWYLATSHAGLFATYVSLFGDPFQNAVEPLIPHDLTHPSLSFPWADGETWYYTGGPHGGWGTGSAWAALDFVPADDINNCETSTSYARSVADGVIARSEYGIVILDLDGDGFEGTGWTVFYLHITSQERPVAVGQIIKKGDPIGFLSCEGGISWSTHLHIARRYNGEWIAADCTQCPLDSPAPQLNFDGWLSYSFGREYDGSLVKDDQYREACTCRAPLNTFP